MWFFNYNVDVDGLEGMNFFVTPVSIGQSAIQETFYGKSQGGLQKK